MRKICTLAMAGVVIGLLTPSALAAPDIGWPIIVSPQPRGSMCNSGFICWWGQPSFQGFLCEAPANLWSGDGWGNVNADCRDMMDSWKNKSNHDAKWSESWGGGTPEHCMNENGQKQDVAPNRNTNKALRVFELAANPC